MEIVILGSSCAFPTKERNHAGTLLKYDGESLLFDCGEGTQRQLRIAKESPMKITKIFITHWHGDHSLGLAGLLFSYMLHKRKDKLEIYGPKGSKEYFRHMLKAFSIKLNFSVKIHEVSGYKRIANKETYEVYSANMKHTVTCVGYTFIEKDKRRINLNYLKKFKLKKDPILKKLQAGRDITWKGKKIKAKAATYLTKGRKFTYVTDTKKNPNIEKLAKDSNLFVCEATFAEGTKLKAHEMGHMTAKEAAQIAKKAKVKRLILTHFSQRYKSCKLLLDEAKKHFKNTALAKDFMKEKIKRN
jgi:ribonuclease Z